MPTIALLELVVDQPAPKEQRKTMDKPNPLRPVRNPKPKVSQRMGVLCVVKKGTWLVIRVLITPKISSSEKSGLKVYQFNKLSVKQLQMATFTLFKN